MLITIEMIRAKNPCYDPATLAQGRTEATLVEILRMENVPPADQVWLAIRFLDDKTLRLFACWCARQALARVENPDPRSVAAVDVAERYALGQATDEELATARDAARDAAWAAAWAAARYAAWAAAWAAAKARYAAWAGAAADAAERERQITKLIEMIGDIKC